jgi:hypothetical protein
MTMTIKTNGHTRQLTPFAELPASAQAEYDHTPSDDCSPHFFQYRGQWYDTDEFTRIVQYGQRGYGFAHYTDNLGLLEWHSIQTSSAFDAIVLRYDMTEYGDHDVVVGHAL